MLFPLAYDFGNSLLEVAHGMERMSTIAEEIPANLL
jgi:hypothetical protein